jgi:hypothetical protein
MKYAKNTSIITKITILAVKAILEVKLIKSGRSKRSNGKIESIVLTMNIIPVNILKAFPKIKTNKIMYSF